MAPFSADHIPINHPQLPGQPPILLTTATTAWYKIPRTPPTCSVPQPRGTEPSKLPREVPYRTTLTLMMQKPRNPNTHPKPNGPWYGTEHPKPRFRHSVPQPRGTERPNPASSIPYHNCVVRHPQNASSNIPYHNHVVCNRPNPSTGFRTVPHPRFIVVKRSSRVRVLYTCPAVPLMRHTPCINYMLRIFVVIMCVSTVKY